MWSVDRTLVNTFSGETKPCKNVLFGDSKRWSKCLEFTLEHLETPKLTEPLAGPEPPAFWVWNQFSSIFTKGHCQTLYFTIFYEVVANSSCPNVWIPSMKSLTLGIKTVTKSGERHQIGNKSEAFIKEDTWHFFMWKIPKFWTLIRLMKYFRVLEKMRMCPAMSWKCPGILLWWKCGNHSDVRMTRLW